MKNVLLDRLREGPLLGDGAMGTALYADGIPYERCFDELNLVQPDLVERIHREYIAAGAELIETNTFGANRFRLAAHGLERKVRDVNYRGVKIASSAREIVGEHVLIAGAIGPIGRPLAPVGEIGLDQARDAFAEQAAALLEGGADLLILETFSDLQELEAAVIAAKTTGLPVIAQLTFTEESVTLAGDQPEDAASRLESLGVDVVGVNCSVGPQGVLDVVHRLASATKLPISAFPNAGFPSRIGGRYFYLATPAYFGATTRRLIDAGARIVGGCCGTTVDHIRTMRDALDRASPRRRSTSTSGGGAAATSTSPPVVDPSPRVSAPVGTDRGPAPAEGDVDGPVYPTPLARKLAEGRFVVSVELDPPRGLNPSKALQGAAMLRDLGADCINIGDSPMAKVRMGCVGFAVQMQQQVGVETIIHFTPRDRNLMALQSDLLAAHALGVRNVLAVTGDPPRVGNYPSATGVWDVDSVGLIAILKRFNEGTDWAGTSIGRKANFFVACAVTPTAEDVDRELERLQRKIEAGADFVMSQPLFSMEQLDEFTRRAGKLPVPHVLGILPLESHRHAELLHNEVPGISVPVEIRERMRRAGERGKEEGLRIAQEFLEQARPHVAGVYIITSYGRYDVAGELVRYIRQTDPVLT